MTVHRCASPVPDVGGARQHGGVSGQQAGQQELPGVGPRVEIRRSRRRRRTVQAYLEGDTVVVLMPAGLSRTVEQQHVTDLLGRLRRREQRRRPSEPDLLRRAERLRREYLPQAPEPVSVRYVSNQQQRWGSCTPADRTIRLTDRLIGMPSWVLDYVLLHELCHLVRPAHDAAFHALLSRYPAAERAKGFLLGVDHDRALDSAGDHATEYGPHLASPGADEVD